MGWTVELYEDRRGYRPVADFFDNLNEATLNKVFRVIDLLRINGPTTPLPYSKKITNNISELRTAGKAPIRVLYARSGVKYVLLHVFIKKTNKLPVKELHIAENRFNQID